MSQERFVLLMRQFIEDQINEQDLTELKSLVAAGGYDGDMRKLYDEVYERPVPDRDLAPERVQKILYAIYDSEEVKDPITATIPGTGTIRRTGDVRVASFRQRTVARWTAAAAVLLLFAGGYLLIKWRAGTAPAVRVLAVRPPLPAPTGKVILTLANGEQVVLDSSVNGKLAEQNGVSVVKTDSGQLTYITGKKTALAGQYNTLATPRGGQYQIVLPDGTKVWLNSASSLRYPTVFNGAYRNVELSGEAYFEVARNSHAPFTVNAAGMQVAVLGTAFNLMAYTDEEVIRTTLVNGSVRLQSPKGTQLIQPGEQGSLDKKEPRFTVSRPDLEEVLAWKNGEFKFSGLTIQTIMRQMARWYDVDIEYQGTPPLNRFNGDITRTQNATALLDMLETTKTVHFEIAGRKIIVIKGPAVDGR